MQSKQRLLIAASGTPEGGGTGCEHLIMCSKVGLVDSSVVGVLSDHSGGGVRKKAERLGVEFFLYTPQHSYHDVLEATGATHVVFCGWYRDVYGLDPTRTIAVVRCSAGSGTYFDAHEYATEAYYQHGNVPPPEIIIRFVTGPTVNNGPVIIRIPVAIHVGPDFQLPRPRGSKGGEKSKLPHFEGTPRERLARITKYWLRESQWHYVPQVVNHVLSGIVRWDGGDESSLRTPPSYPLLQRTLSTTSCTRA